MINKTKTKILTLSVASIVGLAAITVLASNANNALELQGEVKQNAHLELNELKLIENPTKPGVTSKTDVTWKMDDNELVATKEAKGTTNRVEGQWTLSIWGQSNSISESESFILWGKNNTLNAKTSIIGASNSIKGEEGEGDTVLGSSDVTFTWSNNIVQSANGTNIKGSGNIVLSTNQVNITTNNTMAIGNKAIVSGQGSFVFNGTTESLKSTQEFTTLISGNNGMIINTNKRNTPNVGLTVNWGIKVGQTKDLDQQWSLITQDTCLQLKSTEKGVISLKCRGVETDRDQILQTPKCWRNAKEYQANATTWLGQTEKDFCENGKLQPVQVPVFFTDKDRANAQWNGSYAKAGFWNYNFTICFWENDPFCAPQSLSKTWRCSTSEENASVCEATQVVKKDKKAPTKTTCQAWRHHEGESCVSNTKTVDCDATGINKNNGSIEKSKVTITWSNGKWSSPEKCQLTCNTGYELKKEWDNRYCAEKKTKTYQCIGDVPKFSSPILNDDKDLNWDTKISLVERGWNTASKCEYQCNKWYFKVWNRCEKPCYATMVRDGVSNPHYINYKTYYYIPHRFIKWNSYNPYALAAIKSDFFKILDLGNFPTENIGSSLYYKVPNRLKYANATKFTSLDRDSNKNTALFIKDTICSTEECDYLYVRPRDDMIEKGVTDLSSLYSEGHYTYVSVEEAKNGFFTSPWWNHSDRSGNLWSALCFFDQTISSGGSCTSSVGYTWWPHALHAPYYCSDVYPKDEYGKCWGTMTQNGEPCSEMKTKDACNKYERQNNSMYYCKWNEK